MAKTGIRKSKEEVKGSGLGGTLLKMLAVGIAGGALLISGAKKAGEKIEEKEKKEVGEEEE